MLTEGFAPQGFPDGGPLSTQEAFQIFGKSRYDAFLHGYVSTGGVTAWPEPGRTTRYRYGGATGPTHAYNVDREAGVARLAGAADSDLVRKLRRDPWTRIVAMHHLHWHWTAAEGTVEISRPSQEPGDEIGQELLASGLIGRPGRWDKTRDGLYQHAVEDQIVVIRLTILDVYGERLPESEHWDEVPTYW
ncbi:hypothetical protein ACIPPS_11670 [Streptomyces sp. NPDC090127]|uniref:hypothetical protein n=1 Tax=Streptomyces sp. NPDC090127 TaxID=3365953 RepID=UPI003822C54B